MAVQIKAFFCGLVFAVFASLYVIACADAGARLSIIASHTKVHPGAFLSPDRRFRAVLSVGEGEEASLRVYDGRLSARPVLRLDDVEGFVWVPGTPHSLVVAASGTYGRAMLAYWNGGR